MFFKFNSCQLLMCLILVHFSLIPVSSIFLSNVDKETYPEKVANRQSESASVTKPCSFKNVECNILRALAKTKKIHETIPRRKPLEFANGMSTFFRRAILNLLVPHYARSKHLKN